VVVLPWTAFALIVFHFLLARKHGVAPPPGQESSDNDGIPFFPNHLLRTFIVGTLVLAVTFSLAALFPRPVGDPANPFQLPGEIVSSWVVVDVSLALIRYLGVWGLSLFTLLGIVLMLLPLFDRKPERRLRRRPVALVLGLLYFGGFVIAWLAGRQLTSVQPTVDLREGSVQERVQVPPSGEATENGERESNP
jgi:quinol-cytochrome oxidoreductase complex cytochrome b subunit